MRTVLTVEDMTCGHCKSTVEGALISLEGVAHAEVELDAKRATVDHTDEVDEAALRKAVADAGYTVTAVAG